jgi:hypothetical protein
MINYYSPGFNSKGKKPNRIISIIEFIQPELKLIQVELEKSNFKEAILQYENLKKQYEYIVVDLVGLANAYIHIGEAIKAEDFLDELIASCEINELTNQPHIEQAQLIRSEIHQKRDTYFKIMDKLMYRHDITDEKDTFRLFSELANCTLTISNEEAEYYLYMALSNITNPSKFKTNEFSGIMDTLLKSNDLCSMRIANKIVMLNHELNGGIEKSYSIAFKKLIEFNHLDIPVRDIPEKLEPMENIADFKMKDLLERLFEGVNNENPSFAFAVAQ